MILVRNSFVAKSGQASKLAGMFKEVAAAAKIPKHRVMTDVVGDFNTVVFEFEAENLAEVERQMEEYRNNPVFQQKMAGYTDLYVTGRRDVLKIW